MPTKSKSHLEEPKEESKDITQESKAIEAEFEAKVEFKKIEASIDARKAGEGERAVPIRAPWIVLCKLGHSWPTCATTRIVVETR